ncbi:MAG: hypothetical protein AB7U73_22070 [Pirellulales bacterium]
MLAEVEQAAPNNLPVAAGVVVKLFELRRKGEEATQRAGVAFVSALHFREQVQAFGLGKPGQVLDVGIFDAPEGMAIRRVERIDATDRRKDQ